MVICNICYKGIRDGVYGMPGHTGLYISYFPVIYKILALILNEVKVNIFMKNL